MRTSLGKEKPFDVTWTVTRITEETFTYTERILAETMDDADALAENAYQDGHVPVASMEYSEVGAVVTHKLDAITVTRSI